MAKKKQEQKGILPEIYDILKDLVDREMHTPVKNRLTKKLNKLKTSIDKF